MSAFGHLGALPSFRHNPMSLVKEDSNFIMRTLFKLMEWNEAREYYSNGTKRVKNEAILEDNRNKSQERIKWEHAIYK
jgi:hypothetical protein